MSKDTRSSYRALRPATARDVSDEDHEPGLAAVVFMGSSIESGPARTWKLPKFDQWWLKQDLATADTPIIGAQGWTG
jgi:hypothetical protein